MLQALQRLRTEFAFAIDVVDVDADERLVAKYDELVPVLVGCRIVSDDAGKSSQSDLELCHYFFDDTKVRAFLAGV